MCSLPPRVLVLYFPPSKLLSNLSCSSSLSIHPSSSKRTNKASSYDTPKTKQKRDAPISFPKSTYTALFLIPFPPHQPTATLLPPMPRTALPPTPGSSSDIKGKDGNSQLSSLQLAFELPPPAIHDSSRVSPVDLNNSSSASATPRGSQSSSSAYPSPLTGSYPMQAAEAVKARRRSSAARDNHHKEDSFALPPPPTRSRKIIQMKPRGQEDVAEASAKDSKSTGKGSSGKGANSKANSAADKEQGKKKQPSATSAAGRKIARKTAHSLIERRRRSKMNEEFALLKSMIPACTGEMHKLAILQVCSSRDTANKQPLTRTGIYRIRTIPRRLRPETQRPTRRRPEPRRRQPQRPPIHQRIPPYLPRRQRHRHDRLRSSHIPRFQRQARLPPSFYLSCPARPGLTPSSLVAIVGIYRVPQAKL